MKWLLLLVFLHNGPQVKEVDVFDSEEKCKAHQGTYMLCIPDNNYRKGERPK